MNCRGPAEFEMLCPIRVGQGRFGLATSEIREVLGERSPHPVPLAPRYIEGVIPYRGEVLTTVSLRTLLGLERAKANCILVLEDVNDELYGLAVDSVAGVDTVPRNSLRPNPSTLDAKSAALFSGAYQTDSGLMVRLESRLLRPSRLATIGSFGAVKHGSPGDRR